jgi:hypothetical protein
MQYTRKEEKKSKTKTKKEAGLVLSLRDEFRQKQEIFPSVKRPDQH